MKTFYLVKIIIEKLIVLCYTIQKNIRWSMVYSIFDYPVKVYGIPLFEKEKKLERFPEELRKKLCEAGSQLEHITTRTAGARAAFRTDSKRIRIEMMLKTLSHDVGMSRFSCSSLAVYTGHGEGLKFRGLAVPGFDDKLGDIEFINESGTDDVMLFFPRNEIVEDIKITLDDGAEILPPTPYKYEKPVIFFGSSITEGGHSSLVTNAYTALLSRWLSFDYYNFGLSGSCTGQLPIADFICYLNPSVFVYDYDYNACSAEHLSETHEPFFKRVREKLPDLPVVMMSAPNYEHITEADERREIIRNTYENARASGDENVYFIDGKDFFGDEERQFCTTDTTHPNDYGFHKMARVIAPLLKDILEKM